MRLEPSDLVTLSRLLDQAMEVPPAGIEHWLSQLEPDDAWLVPHLRHSLRQRNELPAFLCAGPSISADDATVARPGDRVGPYRLLRELGEGGMGAVWLAEQVDGRVKRNVALKLPRLAWGAGLADRMRRERDIGALLEHPHIARLYDAGVDDQGRPYLAFEHIDGVSLDEWCHEQQLTVRARLQLFLQVIRAVAYAHARLVVHRDLKPSNVLIDAEGQAHLLDFGIAKLLDDGEGGGDLTREHGRALTYRYAAPEQIRGQAITVAADVYAIGVMLYENLVGQPFRDPPSSPHAPAWADALDVPPSPPSSRVTDRRLAKALKGELDAILCKSLEPEVARRYPTMDALADDIQRHLDGDRVLAQPGSAMYKLRVALRRHRFAVLATSQVCGVAAVGGALTAIQAQRAAAATQRQDMVTDFVSDVFRMSGSADVQEGQFQAATSRRFLVEGAEMIEKRFEKEPRLQAQLYGAVSRSFLEMGAYEQAATYSTRQLDKLRLTGGDAEPVAEAMINLSKSLARDGYWDTGDDLQADEQAERTAEDAERQSIPFPARHADALAWRARVLLARGKRREANQLLERLAALVEGLGRHSIAESWLHETRGRMLINEYDQSNQLRRKAIEIAEAVEGRSSTVAAQQRLSMAYNCINHGQIERAKELADAAFETYRRVGGQWVLRGAIGEARWATEFYLWRRVSYTDALAVIEAAQRILNSQAIAPKVLSSQVEYSLGLLRLYHGDAEGAWGPMKAGADLLLQDRLPNFTRFMVVNRLADAATLTGHYVEAEGLVEEQGRIRVLQGEGSNPFAVFDKIGLALIYNQSRDFDRAIGIIDRIPKFDRLSAPGEQAAMLKDVVSWARARILLDRGDVTAAWSAVEELQPHDDADAEYGFSERALLAEIRCARGEPGAVAELEAVANDLSTNRYEHALLPAWIRAKAGLCASARGDLPTARRLAIQAGLASDVQQGVAEYYKEPLRRLRRHLDSTNRVNASAR